MIVDSKSSAAFGSSWSHTQQREVKILSKTSWSDGGQVDLDPAKVKAIQEVPIPKNVSDVHRFLGMVNQLGQFSPNLTEKAKPL